ncbi:MAG: N-6 DNA methylase [Acetobacter sp.]|nr:N-6 DNA methylase [Acetobacter sp.]
MERVTIVNKIGPEYVTSNIEGGEYSYVKAAGSRKKLEKAVGHEIEHFKLDIRFENNDVAVLIETKQNFEKVDEKQLADYVEEENALHSGKKIIAILANISNDKIKVWRSKVDANHFLNDEKVLDSMEHYESLFAENDKQNDREQVLRNTYNLNETLHKKDIDEDLRSQFVGTTLLYIKGILKRKNIFQIDKKTRKKLDDFWKEKTADEIRAGIDGTLKELLSNSGEQKDLKIKLLQKSVIKNEKIEKLTVEDWVDILDEIFWNIYRYINPNSSEGQDLLNLFFIAFNKYTGKKNKNQAFTPDHITNFMCRLTGVDCTKRLFDGTCGSGSFLVQGMVLELADVNQQRVTENEKKRLRTKIVKENIYGIEVDPRVFGLSTTNMLIHGDGNSNILKGDLFKNEEFFRKANPDIVLMNPPYNAKPINIPNEYKKGWNKDAKEDPTKGMVFLKFISDVFKKMNEEHLLKGEKKREIKVAILLPVSTAIGSNNHITALKKELLEDNTLEAVFTLPDEIFYPGASACACCMVFTLGRPHVNSDGTVKKTFFGYYKDDGHKKKKNLGRIEQFDKDNNSIWKKIEEEWLDLYRNKTVKDGMSAMQAVSGDDEWLCEAYMKTDYSKLSEHDFQKILNNYLAYLVKEGKVYGT